MRKYLTLFVIFVTCGVAFGPLCVELVGPAAYARWMLALAANQYQDANPEQAKETLKKAMDASSVLAADPDFWKLRFQMEFDKELVNPKTMDGFYEETKSYLASADEADRIVGGFIAAGYFERNHLVRFAIDIQTAVFPPIEKRTAMLNNQMAYFRSINQSDLEIALAEIDAALAAEFNPAFLDTKAWVLHGLRKNELALKYVNRSIELYYEALRDGKGGDEKRITLYRLLEPDSSIGSKSFEKNDSKDEKSQLESVEGESELKLRTGSEGDEIVSGSDSKRVSGALDSEKTNLTPKENILEGVKGSVSIPPSEQIKIESIAKDIAVIRFHRACILDDLGRTEESEIDYLWLDRFGFSNTQKLH